MTTNEEFWMTDVLTRQIAAQRPSTAGESGWADSASGRAVLEAAIHEARPTRRRRRLFVVGMGSAVVLGGGATALATINSAPPSEPRMVLCNQTASLQANGAGVTLDHGTPAAAAMACGTHWPQMFPTTPQPERFAICVYPVDGKPSGGQVAIPTRLGTTDSQVCGSLGTVRAR